MNDDQKNTDQTSASTEGAFGQQPSKIPAAGGLPGIGMKPAGGGLPGLTSRPPAAGGLPGLGGGGLPGLGGKPAGGGLPGLGAKPTGGLPGMGAKPGGGLPGMGAGPSAMPGAAVPTFIQKQQEAERQKAMSRDPFSADVAPAANAGSFAARDIEAAGPAFSEVEAGKSNKAIYIVAGVLAIVFFGIGYGAGLAVNQRGMLNKVLRDAWIVQYEMQQLRELHGEVQGMVNTALADAQQKKFHEGHVAFLAQKVNGNPFDARLFTDRNYKTLNPLVVQMMANLYNNWDKLATMVAEHRAATNNDEKSLKTAGEEFQKLLAAQYGVIFSRDKNNNGALTANIVVLGAANGDAVQIQANPGSYSDERKLYNPEGADDKLTTEPDQYVIPVGDSSKKTILQNATQSHFNAYTSRLEEMAKLLKIMAEEQENMFGPLDDNCSREPVAPFTARGIDPEAEFEEYKANKANRAAAAEE